jgi:hypothetical protein
MPADLSRHYPLIRSLCGLPGVALEGPSAQTEPFALLLAAAMLYPAEGPLPYRENRDTDMILRKVHPDVQEVEHKGKRGEVLIETVRDVQMEAHLIPNQAPGRVFILNAADLITPEAQNALLKVTEEPPKGVRFIFTLENSHNLLPTLRSRLVVVPLSASVADLPGHLSPKARTIAAMLPDWQGLVDRLGAKAAERLLDDCAAAREAILSDNGYRLLVLFAAQDKKREGFIAFCQALRVVCVHELLAAGGYAPRFLRAITALDEAATKAGGNVQLPLLGIHTVAAILP